MNCRWNVFRHAIACAVMFSIFALSARLAPAQSSADSSTEESSESTAPEPTEKVPAAKKSTAKKVVLDPALQLTDPRTYQLKLVHRVEAPDGVVNNVVVVGPVPIEWPEQQLRLLNQKTSPGVRLTEHVMKGQGAILRMQVASIPKGEAAYVERLYEITRYRTQFTMPGEELTFAKTVPHELRDQLTGPAPGLEMTHPKIIELAETLRKEKPAADPWDTTHNFWSWIRDNVKFENGDFRGALFAVENRCGDCEEMSSLFVSICRLSGITARSVWVEGHNYPEFYLADKKGKGHWIPAQVVGPPWFGEMSEFRPIFQKGDRFFDPFQKQYVRYVPATVRADGSSSKPKLIVEHQIIADSDINGPSYNSTK